jgi:queuine tRNA-ribosyltransferase
VDSQPTLGSTRRPLEFEVQAQCGRARAGYLHLRRCDVATPLFMPVGTQATVKALTPAEIESSGARMIIMNTYHLWLRPTPEVVSAQGGLHEFSRWPHAIATDSGGFQAFSLAALSKLTEEGFAFQSHLDGSRHLLSPEESMRIQGLLDSDIAMQLDVCPDSQASVETLKSAVERTTRWAERCLAARKAGQAMFAIVQGGTDLALRQRHAAELAELPVDGLALGGFSVGEPIETMHALLELLLPTVDERRPRYLMGVGTPSDLVRAIAQGVDMFDCVLPTRNARNGQAFVSSGRLVIKQARYKDDPRPLDEQCSCPTCTGGFSRSYLRHLFIAREILALRLLTLHNVHFYGHLVNLAREAILAGNYGTWSSEILVRWQSQNK